MATTDVNIGSAPNDGKGDTLRRAFEVINENFKKVMPLLDPTNPTLKMKVGDTGLTAQMQVIYKGHDVAEMAWTKGTGGFSFMLNDQNTGVQKAAFEIKADGKAYMNGKELATMEAVAHARTTIEHNIKDHAKPTAAECKTVFKLLPHFDWKKDDDFYIKDTTGGKLVLIKYRATPAATEAAPGNFFYEVLTPAA